MVVIGIFYYGDLGSKWDSIAKVSDHCFFIYAAHGRGVYICGHLFRIPAHAELFGLFHLFTMCLEEFDYTAGVQHILHATGCS